MKLYLDAHPDDPEAAPGKGEVPAEFALVGMAPSPNRPRDRYNEPFGTSSWQLLSRILGILPGSVYTTNLVKTPQPSGKKLRKALVSFYYPRLEHELLSVQPRKILALGTEVAKVLCPGFKEMREDHGTLFFNPVFNATVVPTYHFSAVGRNPANFPILARDLQRFLELERPTGLPPFSVLKHLPEIPKGCLVYLDIETTSLEPEMGEILSLGMFFEGGETPPDGGMVLILEKPQKSELINLLRRLRAAHATLVGHNLQFDLEWLMAKSEAFWDVPVEDTMLIAHTQGEEILALKHLTTTLTDRPGSRGFGGIEDPGYLAEDVLSTQAIRAVFRQRQPEVPFVQDMLHRIVPITVAMRRRGVPIDRARLEELLPVFEQKAKDTAAVLDQKAGRTLNWNSTGQVREFLLSQGVKLIEKTEAGALSVKESVLLGLKDRYPVVSDLLTFRDQVKELTFLHTYLKMTSPEHPLLHPKLLLHGTRTGRLSCVDPNLQQVKRTGPVKTLFHSRWEGGLIGLIDLSQAELRVACLLSDDPVFAEALLGEDIHRHNASIVYRKPPEAVTPYERKKSKGVTFGVLYGGGPAGLASRIGVSVAEVEEIQTALFTTYKKLARYVEQTKRTAVREGQIGTLFGRIRDLKGIIASKGERDAKRKAINTPIQGLASDIALMILLYTAEQSRERGLKSRVMFGVHDSVVTEVHPDEIGAMAQVVSDAFENLQNSPLSSCLLWPVLPLVGEYILGPNWASVESTNEFYKPEATFPCSSHPAVAPGGLLTERHDPVDILHLLDDEDADPEEDEDDVPAAELSA